MEREREGKERKEEKKDEECVGRGGARDGDKDMRYK